MQCLQMPEEGVTPWNWCCRWLWANAWLLVIKPGSSASAVSTLNPLSHLSSPFATIFKSHCNILDCRSQSRRPGFLDFLTWLMTFQQQHFCSCYLKAKIQIRIVLKANVYLDAVRLVCPPLTSAASSMISLFSQILFVSVPFLTWIMIHKFKV